MSQNKNSGHAETTEAPRPAPPVKPPDVIEKGWDLVDPTPPPKAEASPPTPPPTSAPAGSPGGDGGAASPGE